MSSMPEQIRLAITDIAASLDGGVWERARYELACLRRMLDDNGSRSWSDFQQMVKEEFADVPVDQ